MGSRVANQEKPPRSPGPFRCATTQTARKIARDPTNGPPTRTLRWFASGQSPSALAVSASLDDVAIVLWSNHVARSGSGRSRCGGSKSHSSGFLAIRQPRARVGLAHANQGTRSKSATQPTAHADTRRLTAGSSSRGVSASQAVAAAASRRRSKRAKTESRSSAPIAIDVFQLDLGRHGPRKPKAERTLPPGVVSPARSCCTQANDSSSRRANSNRQHDMRRDLPASHLHGQCRSQHPEGMEAIGRRRTVESRTVPARDVCGYLKVVKEILV
jgi:hypothetical protein